MNPLLYQNRNWYCININIHYCTNVNSFFIAAMHGGKRSSCDSAILIQCT